MHKIDWKKGSGIALYYMASLWIVAASVVFSVEALHATTSVGKTRMLSDIVADGSAYLGNNGWGIDEEVATEAANSLVEKNKEDFKDIALNGISFEHNGDKEEIHGDNKNNTVVSDTSLNTKMLTTGSSITKNNIVSKTKITYSGGMKIVIEAYKHTWQGTRGGTKGRHVEYVWGGGHGDPYEWETYADCSGFTSGVFRKCGYDIESGACTWDLEDTGILIGTGMAALEKARPGDIILYFPGAIQHGLSNHVATYAGKYKGTYWQVESTGSRTCTYAAPGRGADGRGAHLDHVRMGKNFMVRRIVDSEAKAEYIPSPAKYKPSEMEVMVLAGVCVREQGTDPRNIQACASFILNLYEKNRGRYASPYDYVMNSGWFGHKNASAYTYATPEAMAILRDVFENGNRSLPPFIDEYDWIYDITSADNNGVPIDRTNRHAYIPGVTRLHNRYGSTYTFYCFPDGADGVADPFGYIGNAAVTAGTPNYALANPVSRPATIQTEDNNDFDQFAQTTAFVNDTIGSIGLSPHF